MTAIDWQPIETAPKDCDVLLWIPLGGKDLGFRIGRWDHDEYASRPRPYWTTDRELTFGRLWQRANQPTHWAPIPEGPR